LPSSRSDPTTSARFSFAVAGIRLTHGGELHELRGRELLGTDVRRTADRRERLGRGGAIGEPGELERVRKRLSPVRERRLDDLLEPRPRLRQRPAPAEGDERRVDVRPRAEDLARDRVEAGAFGRQLHEHGDRAVGLRGRRGEEAVGDLALHHHAPELDGRQAGEALGHERSRDVVRQVGDELVRRRLERGEVERERVAEVEPDVVGLGQVRLERAVELDRVDEGDAAGEEAREDAEAGADLEDDVVRLERGEPLDHAQDVLVDEEVLAELLLRVDVHASPNAASAFCSICVSSSAWSTPRISASVASV
jgi:hypothetical protein